MNLVTLDKDLRARLNGLDQQTLFTDENGIPLGYFLPPWDYQKLIGRPFEIPLSEEEIARRRQIKEGCSLEDIWKPLGAK